MKDYTPLEGFFDEDGKNINNPMHDILVWDPFVPKPRLEALVEVIPLVSASKSLLHTYRFMIFFYLWLLCITNL